VPNLIEDGGIDDLADLVLAQLHALGRCCLPSPISVSTHHTLPASCSTAIGNGENVPMHSIDNITCLVGLL
jgi:hypothetical protein